MGDSENEIAGNSNFQKQFVGQRNRGILRMRLLGIRTLSKASSWPAKWGDSENEIAGNSNFQKQFVGQRNRGILRMRLLGIRTLSKASSWPAK
jgi:hypothetical protein